MIEIWTSIPEAPAVYSPFYFEESICSLNGVNYKKALSCADLEPLEFLPISCPYSMLLKLPPTAVGGSVCRLLSTV
jgi:hypothetical protein